MSEISRHFFAYLVAAVLFGIFAFYLFLSNRKVRIVREFAMLQLSLGVFSGVTVLMNVLDDIGVQLILQRILFFLALGIAGVFLLFARDAANMTGRIRIFFSGIVFVVLTIFGVTAFIDWIWPQQGLYPLVTEWAGTAMIAAFTIVACIFGFSFWRHETTMTRERLKVLFVASLGVFAGSLVYASRWVADDVMRSVVFLGFYGGASALGVYALRRHRIIELGEVVQKSLVWIAVSGLLFLFLYFFLAIFRLWLLRQDVAGFLVAFSFLFLLTLVLFRFFYQRFDQVFRRAAYQQAYTLDRFRKELITLRSTAELFDRIEGVLYETLQIEHMAAYRLVADPTPRILLLSHAGARAPQVISVTDLDALDEFFQLRPLVAIDDEVIRQASLPTLDIQNILSKFNGQMIIALKIQKKVSAFLILGKRKYRKPYTQNATQLLEGLLPSIQIAYSNAKLYEESKEWSKDLERKVAERADELEGLNREYLEERDEANRLSSVTLGRESRLLELQKELARLEKQG